MIFRQALQKTRVTGASLRLLNSSTSISFATKSSRVATPQYSPLPTFTSATPSNPPHDAFPGGGQIHPTSLPARQIFPLDRQRGRGSQPPAISTPPSGKTWIPRLSPAHSASQWLRQNGHARRGLSATSASSTSATPSRPTFQPRGQNGDLFASPM